MSLRHVIVLFTSLMLVTGAHGYETDPYTNRHVEISDSTSLLDDRVNDVLDDLSSSWTEGEDEWQFIMAIYHILGGLHWVDKLERWAINSDAVEKLPNSRKMSIYQGLPLYATRVAGLFGFGPTIKLNGAYVGTDKIGHFFSQGRKFYARYLRHGDEARAARRSIITEKYLFGLLTTGVYSNADLVANYEGYLFYRSLFHDDIVPGKTAIFRWEDGRPVRQRNFMWSDHVNAFWDEAVNANHYDRLLMPHVRKRLLALCDQYRQNPALYQADDEEILFAKYRHVGVVDTSELRASTFFSSNCSVVD
ncbi:MAG: hypothetical protein O7F71_02630 [Gammaproteobacteria bacterium]|nr:hypothetical protein [Gammaproteobacteria bacterium]